MADALIHLKHTRAPETVHQALHGYSSGHRLLQCSIQLPDDVARVMLRMSDLSGSNVVAGFDEYLTGYPLESTGMYALAKTWYAREMARPGCVWTHTLFLSQKDLEAASLAPLVNAFKRPLSKSAFESYSKPLEVTTGESTAPSAADLSWFIESFYTVKPAPLLIPAKTAAEFEPMLLAAWSQQWPSLRRVFSFCTGSLSSRRLGKEPLEVQCVPVQLVRDVQLELNSIRPSEPVALYSSEFEVSAWTSAAATDCLLPAGGEFRKFLWEVAGEDGKREDYFAFVRLHALLAKTPAPAEALALVADLFPSPEQAAHLKVLLFGEGTHFFPETDEASLLATIGSSPGNRTLEPKRLNLENRGAAVARDYESARRLIGGLFQSPLNPVGLEILSGLLSDWESQAAREITREQPQFLATLIKAQPSLAVSPLIWKSAADRRWALMESIMEDKSLHPDTIKGIVAALMDSGTDDLLRWAFEDWSQPAVFGALDWMAAHDGRLPEAGRFALTFQVQHVMDWVEHPTDKPLFALFVAADIVAPYSYQICARDTAVWEPALKDALRRYEESDALRFLTFILALALGNAPPEPLDLVGATFEIVHRAELNRRLPDSAWRILEPIAPTVFPHYWDKCERMRRALITSFVKHSWPPSELRHRISDSDLVRDLVHSAKRVDEGKNYMKGSYR
jgi:hypothetical protein